VVRAEFVSGKARLAAGNPMPLVVLMKRAGSGDDKLHTSRILVLNRRACNA
jgi:hypothetical protein